MKRSETTTEVSKAMSAAQKSMKKALKDANNPHFKSRYADLASLWDASSDSLANNDLFVMQDLTNNERGIEVLTIVTHSSGEWLEFGPFSLPVNDFKPQTYGSACTYAKRYALQAALNIVSDDDDGQAATFIDRDKQDIFRLTLGEDDSLKRWFWELIKKEYNAKGLESIPLCVYGSLRTSLEQEKLRCQSVTKTDIKPVVDIPLAKKIA